VGGRLCNVPATLGPVTLGEEAGATSGEANFMRLGSAFFRAALAMALVGLATAGSAKAGQAQQTLQIHVVLSLTGGAAFLGQSQQKTLQLLQDLTNKQGGIKGEKLEFVFADDQSSPQNAVQALNTVLPDKPNVMLGPNIVAMCNAITPMLHNGPLDYCTSPGIYPADGGFVYSSSVSTKALMETTFRYFHNRGWMRIALITSTDASGQDAVKNSAAMLEMPEFAGMQIVDKEQFNTTDVSVAAQIEHIKQANPQALIAWSTGAPIATVFKAAIQDGLDLPTVTTNGNQTNAEMLQFASFLPKQLLIPSSLFIRHAGLYTLDPKVEAEQKSFYDAIDAAKLPLDNMAALAWDPGRILIELLRRVGPNASAAELREALANTSAVAGVNGIYDFKKYPQRGLSNEEVVMSGWNAQTGQWTPLSLPGGKPLPH
jgi:branched-chain amino acid transport system substrate-binding protein